MLALVLVVLGQCSVDTECKGDRICAQGQCVEPSTPATPVPRLSSVARAAQLGEEIGQRRAVLDDSSIVGPSLKLAAGIIMLVIGAVAFRSYHDAVDNNLDCFDGCQTAGAIGLPLLIAGPGFIIWGGVQLVMSIWRLATLPGEIRTREDEIRALDAK